MTLLTNRQFDFVFKYTEKERYSTMLQWMCLCLCEKAIMCTNMYWHQEKFAVLQLHSNVCLFVAQFTVTATIVHAIWFYIDHKNENISTEYTQWDVQVLLFFFRYSFFVYQLVPTTNHFIDITITIVTPTQPKFGILNFLFVFFSFIHMC